MNFKKITYCLVALLLLSGFAMRSFSVTFTEKKCISTTEKKADKNAHHTEINAAVVSISAPSIDFKFFSKPIFAPQFLQIVPPLKNIFSFHFGNEIVLFFYKTILKYSISPQAP